MQPDACFSHSDIISLQSQKLVGRSAWVVTGQISVSRLWRHGTCETTCIATVSTFWSTLSVGHLLRSTVRDEMPEGQTDRQT